MKYRNSWDTAIKHLVRNGLLKDILTVEQIKTIPSSNLSRWKYEPEDKYLHCEINEILKQEIALIKRLNQSTKIKSLNESYFRLCDTFHEIISNIKGVKSTLKNEKELIVNSIESVKNCIPINNSLKLFNISRSTYENYKSIVIHKCEASYFKWCKKRHPNQLLTAEVETIKKYMLHTDYRFWAKSSVYLKAVRDNTLSCCISTFYKYCRLLGFKDKFRIRNSDNYNPIKTTKPNELWCADVTIFKTVDSKKYHIHFLIDHFSRMILGYRIETNNSGKAIRDLLYDARLKYKPEKLHFLTDGGSENVNNTVSKFLNSLDIETQHTIAQKDVTFSNSMIEAVNKVIKHQFLYHKDTSNYKSLKKAVADSVLIYNKERPQMALGGNTPLEIFNGIAIDFSIYKNSFKTQKRLRVIRHKQNSCKVCT